MLTFQSFKTEFKEIFRLGLPIAIGSLSGMVISIANTWLLGKISTVEVAAAGSANPIFWIIALIGMSALSMTSPLIAAANEKDDKREMRKILSASWLLALIFALVEMVILIAIALNFNALGYEPEVAEKGKAFLFSMLPALVPMMLFVNAVHFTDGLSLTRVGMVISLLAIVITLFFNWILMFGKLGLPKLGLVGCGLSLVVAELFQFVAMWIYLNRTPIFQPILKTVVTFSEVRAKMKEYAAVALPVGLQAAAEYFAFSLGAIWIGQLGKYPLAAHQISITLVAATWVVFMAIGAAGSIRVAQGFGANDRELMKTAGTTAILMGVLFVFLPALAYVFLPNFIAKQFIDDPSVISIATTLILVGGFFQIFDALQTVSINILRGLEDTKLPTIGTIVAYWVLGMPLGYYLCFSANWGALGVWIGFLVALLTQAMWFIVRFYWLTR